MLSPVEVPFNEGRMCPAIYADALLTSQGVWLYQRTLALCSLVCHTETGNCMKVMHESVGKQVELEQFLNQAS